MSHHQPKGLAKDAAPETDLPYWAGRMSRDAAFSAAMIRAGHTMTGVKPIDPLDARVIGRAPDPSIARLP